MSPERIRLSEAVRSVRLVAPDPHDPRDRHEATDPRETILTLVHERALTEGMRRGRAAVRDDAVQALDAAAERVDAACAQARDALARTAVELAVEIARRLLRREIPSGNYDLERIVREALQEAAAGRGPCVVHLNPADHERLADVRFRTGTRIQADEGVSRGDVHVETSLGLLVREAFGALDSIEQRLLEELH